MKTVSFFVLTLGVALRAQTLHEDDKGGSSQTVSIYTKSRTHLDGGILRDAGLAQISDNEIWQHGHEGPRILRVILPDWAKHHRPKDLLGRTLQENDIIEISLINPKQQNSSVGTMTLQRLKKDGVGFLTSGHAELTGVSLRDCAPVCPVCSERERPRSGACVEALNKIKAELKTGGVPPDTTWIFKATSANSAALKWVPKSPADFDAVRQVIVAKLPAPVRFDFGLTNDGDLQAVSMKELVLKRGTTEVLRTPMPIGSRFQVCGADETTNKPLCDPLPECQTFWRRHFNRSCKIYGGTGVLTDYDPKKHKPHHH